MNFIPLSIRIALRIIVGIVFIVSAVAKLFPIEFFELIILRFVDIPFVLVPFSSRFVIGLELLLGIFLVVNFNPKQITLLSTFSVLIFFTVLLFVQHASGSEENCGCFGTLLPMTPMQSIVKNVVLLLIIIPLYLIGNVSWIINKWIILGIMAISFGAPYIASPIIIGSYKPGGDTREEVLWHELGDLPQENIDKMQSGIQHIALMSAGCNHCLEMAEQLTAINARRSISNFTILVGGNGKEQFQDFMNKTKLNIPAFYIENPRHLVQLAEGRFPTILRCSDGVVTRKWFGSDFNYFEMEKILSE